LVVTDSPGDGKPLALFVVSRETGEKRQLTNPQPPAAGDAHPALSPDGSSLVFRRCPSGIFSGELYRLPLGTGLVAAGEPERLTPQTFHEWAAHSIRYSEWAKAYYQQQRARGKSASTSIRALAYKWIRIVFRCWKDRKPYCDTVYQQALARRRGAAPQVPSSPVQFEWKTCAGFKKIAGLTP
jgi:hypothetical protein